MIERRFVECGLLDRHFHAEVDDPVIREATSDVETVDPRDNNIRVWAAVRVRSKAASLGHIAPRCQTRRPWYPPMKDMPRFSSSGSRRRGVGRGPQVGIDLRDRFPSRTRPASSPSSKPIMETCTLAPSRTQSRSLSAKKMSPVLLDPLQHFAVAPPRMPCVASSPARRHFCRLDMPPGLLKPVAAEVGLARHALVPNAEHGVHVLVAQVGRNSFPPRNGGLPTINSASGQSGSLGCSGSERSRIASWQRMLSIGCSTGSSRLLETVVVHPLQIADPDHDLGKLLGVGVDLQPVKLRRD